MNVAIYARVSKEKDQHCGPQLAELRKYAASRGWTVVGEYVDNVTGNMKKREAKGQRLRYHDLMEDAEKGLFQVVLVWSFDRFARSVVHLTSALEQFQALGIDFRSHTQDLDTTTPTGRLFFHIAAAFAEFERHLISERTKVALKLIKETGFNAEGEPTRLGPKEKLGEYRKNEILHRYTLWESLSDIALHTNTPISTVYSLIRRSLVECKHEKYRCPSCGVTRRAPGGTSPSGIQKSLGKDR